MIFTAILAGALQGDHVTGVSNDADRILLTVAVAADFANWLSRKVKANRTEADLLLGINQGLGERLHVNFRPLKNVERQPLSRFGPDAGKFL